MIRKDPYKVHLGDNPQGDIILSSQTANDQASKRQLKSASKRRKTP